MQALVLERPGQLTPMDITAPQMPGPGQALVRVHRVGICGTDISAFLGRMPFFNYPRIPGHELGVEVLAVGPGVTNVRVGDRCSVEPYVENPNSFASRRGRSNCCEDLQVIGVHTDGGLRAEFVVQANKLHSSIQLTYEQLALVEPLAIGCHAIDRCKPQPDDDILIIGAGPIGLAILQFARLTGARILVMDMHPSRLGFCETGMHLRNTIRYVGDGSEWSVVQDLTNGRWPTIVIDATGSSISMSRAVNYVAHGGTLVYVGVTGDELKFPHAALHRRELSLLASRNALSSDFPRIIRLIEAGAIDTRPWITHRTQFAELPSRFPSFLRPETGVIKAMVEVC